MFDSQQSSASLSISTVVSLVDETGSSTFKTQHERFAMSPLSLAFVLPLIIRSLAAFLLCLSNEIDARDFDRCFSNQLSYQC